MTLLLYVILLEQLENPEELCSTMEISVGWRNLLLQCLHGMIELANISYLSFLPMNHVVEGIMGTYSPYYAPAPLNLYFLGRFP